MSNYKILNDNLDLKMDVFWHVANVCKIYLLPETLQGSCMTEIHGLNSIDPSRNAPFWILKPPNTKELVLFVFVVAVTKPGSY